MKNVGKMSISSSENLPMRCLLQRITFILLQKSSGTLSQRDGLSGARMPPYRTQHGRQALGAQWPLQPSDGPLYFEDPQTNHFW